MENKGSSLNLTFSNSYEGEDSTWKIVYLDMITMLMILFLCLWMIDKQKPEDLKKHGDITLNKVRFEADDYFEPGKADIKNDAKVKMAELFFDKKNGFPIPGVDLANNGRRVVLILGHTDDQGDKRKNFELGFQRALAVYDELSKRLPTLPDNAGICTYADNFPVDRIKKITPSTPKELFEKLKRSNFVKRKKNRRFEIVGQFEELDESLTSQ